MIFDAQCCVVGGGPAGLSAGLALAHFGVEVALIGEPPDAAGDIDSRTAGLFGPSVRLLECLGVWADLRDGAAPIRGIRMVDGGRTLLRAPEVLFAARDVDLDVLGYNVENAVLTAALWRRIAVCPGVDVIDDTVRTMATSEREVVVSTVRGRQIRARLVVAADGRKSVCRSGAGIDAQTWRYPQAAVVARFAHSRDHDGISTEIQDSAGPCTTVPLPGRWSSLVWVTSEERARRLCDLDPHAFGDELECVLGGLLGSVSSCCGIQSFPLSGLSTEVIARNRVALVGEAGHVVPPIGAQGLNMGLADAAAIAEVAGQALSAGKDPGDGAVLAAFDRMRRGDIRRRTLAVDALNRSYVSNLLPGHLLRGIGLHALTAFGFLKTPVMREGLAVEPLPALMR